MSAKERPPTPAARSRTVMACMAGRFLRSAQRPERCPDFGREQVRLLPGGEVVALVDLVEVDELGIGLLSPAPRHLVELAREDAHRGRDGDALDVEEPELVLPVEAGRGKTPVGGS